MRGHTPFTPVMPSWLPGNLSPQYAFPFIENSCPVSAKLRATCLRTRSIPPNTSPVARNDTFIRYLCNFTPPQNSSLPCRNGDSTKGGGRFAFFSDLRKRQTTVSKSQCWQIGGPNGRVDDSCERLVKCVHAVCRAFVFVFSWYVQRTIRYIPPSFILVGVLLYSVRETRTRDVEKVERVRERGKRKEHR